jgi:putative membrane protein
LCCYKFTRQFARDDNVRTARWYRMFNELPSLLLVGIVILAVVKP